VLSRERLLPYDPLRVILRLDHEYTVSHRKFLQVAFSRVLQLLHSHDTKISTRIRRHILQVQDIGEPLARDAVLVVNRLDFDVIKADVGAVLRLQGDLLPVRGESRLSERRLPLVLLLLEHRLLAHEEPLPLEMS
jgi:hypothetical protein